MLSILKSAFNANNKEIGIVSNNIANVNSTAFKKSKTNPNKTLAITSSIGLASGNP